VHVDRGDRHGAERERQRDQILRKIFHRFLLRLRQKTQCSNFRLAQSVPHKPHAVYALVQTALVQDEALKRANARIEELQAGCG
jgi:hypothetical protein